MKLSKRFMKLSKTKKIILLLGTLGLLTTSIVTPIIVIKNENNEKKKEENVQYVKKAIEILEEKSLSERQIKLASNSSGKIIEDNKKEIIAKIKNLIGSSNLKGVSIEISIKEDKEISPSFEEIVVEISKGSYSQKIKPNKIFVARNKNATELIEIDVNLVKDSLNALKVKTIEVYTSGAVDQKITTNKNQILEAIKKLEGYKDIEFNGVSVNVKDSNDALPKNNQNPITITLTLSKNNFSSELSIFKAKQMSLQKMANIDITFVKNALEKLNTKLIKVDTSDSVDQKITTNKNKILDEITKIKGYSEIELKGVSIDVKNSEELLPAIDQKSIAITLILSKSNALPNNIELTIFRAKQQFDVIAKIEDKIIDKEILINPSVSTSNQSEIQKAIKDQLKIKNPSLTNNDLSKISTNISSLDLGIRKELNLKITFSQIEKIIIIYVTKVSSNLLKNSNINFGQGGTIFQDKFKNLWTMGTDSKLQVLKANKGGSSFVNKGWISDNSQNGDNLLRGSKINNGQFGTIFQDSFGNLWAMGKGSKIQVLKINEEDTGYVNTGWISDNTQSGDNLLKNSKITDGFNGIIFQDSFKNLWAMAKDSKLQVLKKDPLEEGYVEEGWINENDKNIGDNLLKNSNINDGYGGVIFQDEFKNLWTIAAFSGLQVLKANEDENGYVNEGWISDNTQDGDKLLKNSNIVLGTRGTIFQDEFKNLWTMGSSSKLQVLKANEGGTDYVNTGWISDNTQSGDNLLKNSKITDGFNGKIFQDSFGNLWAMGNGKKLQVLKANEEGTGYVNEGWISDNTQSGDNLLKNSKITDGFGGTIFQDFFGNLWAIGNRKKLQVLKLNEEGTGYVNEGWINDNTQSGDNLLKNSKIIDGSNGKIFQDESKNLWALGKDSKLQVLRVNTKKDGYVELWQTL